MAAPKTLITVLLFLLLLSGCAPLQYRLYHLNARLTLADAYRTARLGATTSRLPWDHSSPLTIAPLYSNLAEWRTLWQEAGKYLQHDSTYLTAWQIRLESAAVLHYYDTLLTEAHYLLRQMAAVDAYRYGIHAAIATHRLELAQALWAEKSLRHPDPDLDTEVMLHAAIGHHDTALRLLGSASQRSPYLDQCIVDLALLCQDTLMARATLDRLSHNWQQQATIQRALIDHTPLPGYAAQWYKSLPHPNRSPFVIALAQRLQEEALQKQEWWSAIEYQEEAQGSTPLMLRVLALRKEIKMLHDYEQRRQASFLQEHSSAPILGNTIPFTQQWRSVPNRDFWGMHPTGNRAFSPATIDEAHYQLLLRQVTEQLR